MKKNNLRKEDYKRVDLPGLCISSWWALLLLVPLFLSWSFPMSRWRRGQGKLLSVKDITQEGTRRPQTSQRHSLSRGGKGGRGSPRGHNTQTIICGEAQGQIPIMTLSRWPAPTLAALLFIMCVTKQMWGARLRKHWENIDVMTCYPCLQTGPVHLVARDQWNNRPKTFLLLIYTCCTTHVRPLVMRQSQRIHGKPSQKRSWEQSSSDRLRVRPSVGKVNADRGISILIIL